MPSQARLIENHQRMEMLAAAYPFRAEAPMTTVKPRRVEAERLCGEFVCAALEEGVRTWAFTTAEHRDTFVRIYKGTPVRPTLPSDVVAYRWVSRAGPLGPWWNADHRDPQHYKVPLYQPAADSQQWRLRNGQLVTVRWLKFH